MIRKETKKVEKTVVVDETICEVLVCDVCGKEFALVCPKGETHKRFDYFSLTTGHYDWGNDSVDSISHYDLCSEECVKKKLNEYFADCNHYGTAYFNLEQEFKNVWSNREED